MKQHEKSVLTTTTFWINIGFGAIYGLIEAINANAGQAPKEIKDFLPIVVMLANIWLRTRHTQKAAFKLPEKKD